MADRDRPGPVVKFDLVNPLGAAAYIKLADISAVTATSSAEQNRAKIYLVGGQDLTVAISPHDVYGIIMSELYTD